MATTAKKKQTARRRGKKAQNRSHSKLTVSFFVVLSVVCLVFGVFFVKAYLNPYSFQIKALFGTVKYPDGKVRGIDVSHYQSEINWDKLRNADLQGTPVNFIFVKATEGADILDENFNQNFHYARRNEIMRGAYHFFSAKSPAEKQAKYFCKMVQLEDDDLPPVLDVETMGDYTPAQLQKEVLTWLHIVEKHYGVPPILYTSYRFKQKNLANPEIESYPYWIAHYYVDSLTYTGEWKFWQHTDAGKVSGIKGFVDVNLFNGTYEDLVNLTIGAQLNKKEGKEMLGGR